MTLTEFLKATNGLDMDEVKLGNALINAKSNEDFYNLSIRNIPQFLVDEEFFMKFKKLFTGLNDLQALARLAQTSQRYNIEKQLWKYRIRSDKFVMEVRKLTKADKLKAYDKVSRRAASSRASSKR